MKQQAHAAGHEQPSENSQVLVQRAMQALDSGDLANAVVHARDAVTSTPQNAVPWAILCVVLHRSRNFEQAIEAGRKAVELNPASAEYHNVLGVVLRAAGRHREAEASYHAAIKANPRFVAAVSNLGNLARDEGRNREAEKCYRAALAISDDTAELWQGLAAVMQRQGKLDEAGTALERAASLKPNQADIVGDLAMLKAALNESPEAIKLLHKAIELDPNLDSAHGNLGAIELRAGRLAAAERATRRAAELAPQEQRWQSNLGVVAKDLGRFDEAEGLFRRALEMKPGYATGHGNLLFCLNYHPDKSAEEIFAEYRRFDAVHARPHQPEAPSYTNDRSPTRRLRVGYVSPDFREHAARHFLAPLLEHYDRKQIELFCYAEVASPDRTTEQLKTYADHWRSTVGLSDDEVADLMRSDAIDILVDFGGHTSSSRILAMARKPAPIQIAHHLGHGYTSGLSSIDFFVSDDDMAPVGSEHLFSERIVRLPRIPVAYIPPPGMPAASELPALKNGYVTFGYFGRTERLNHKVVRAWSGILARVPNSKLMLNSKAFAEEGFCDLMAERFAAHGIGRDRLKMVYTSPQPVTWSAYGDVDIALDPFPHNAGTTTIEAMWLGVPVVSVEDRPSVGRFGASHLTAVGLRDWLAPNAERYVSLAAEKAADLPALAKLRSELRGRLEKSDLCDGPGLARAMEVAYRTLWTEWCGKNANPPVATPAENDRVAALQTEGAQAYGSGNHVRAIEIFTEVAQMAPTAGNLTNLGAALRAAGRMDDAEKIYREAVRRSPEFSTAHTNLGNLLFARGRNREAEAAYTRVLELFPDDPPTLRNLGISLMRQQRLVEAEPILRHALALSSDDADIRDNLAQLLRQQGQPVAAAAIYDEKPALFETNWRALGNMALLRQDLGRFEEAESLFRRALTLKPDYALAQANLLFCVNYHPTKTAEEIFEEYKRYDAAHAKPHLPAHTNFANDRDPARRLRVGILSPDFREHAARHFIDPLLTNFDREKLEIFCYAEVENPDHVTRHFEELSDHWRSTLGYSDAEVVDQIRRDSIDILMDFGGHTSSSRLRVMARKAAPVQIAYLLGHGYTSGVSAIDAFLADAAMVPEGSEHLFVEQVVRLPRIPIAYVPPKEMPEVAPLPAFEKSKPAKSPAKTAKSKLKKPVLSKTVPVTFGYFGRPERINDRVIAVWSKILKGLPASTLMLNSKAFFEQEFCDLIAERFAKHGISADRLNMVFTSPQPKTWAAYGEVDIALDPFPHNAGTTTIEALWLGVPVVSLKERPSVGRFGASILGAAGLPDWVADDEARYVKLAIAKAKNLEALSDLRASLRDRLTASPLCDGPGLAKDLETAFRELWSKWCESPSTPVQTGTLEGAISAFQAGEYEEALRQASGHLSRSPGEGEALHVRGVSAYRLKRLPEAAADLIAATKKLPGRADVRWNLTVILRGLGRLTEAETYGREAVKLAPNASEAHNNLASVLKDQGRQGEAEAHYRRAVTLKPDYADAWSNLAWILAIMGNSRESESAARRALSLKPRDGNAINNLGTALMQQDRLREAADCFERAVAIKPDFAVAHSNLLFCLNYRTDLSAADIFQAYQKWDTAHALPVMPKSPVFRTPKDPNRKLRIGYVSPDFRYHAVTFFIEEMLAAHDREQFEVTCYAEVPNPDAVTERIRQNADRWCSSVGMSDEDLAQKIRDDEIDVLIDIAGHTGGNRLLTFARRPAPVQVAHMVGSGMTTGLTAIDGFLADRRLVPDGAEKYFSEKVIRLSRIPLVYAPPPGMPEVAAPPAQKNGYVTFGCFSRTARINEGVIGAWAGILKAVPESRLLLNSKPFRETASHPDWLARFEAHGIDAKRVSLVYTSPQPKTWEAYGSIDIALDPFPHNAGTTTIEALWLGVPVVSLASRPPVGRFGAALLGILELDDWVTTDVQGYMRRAVAAASDMKALAHLRAGLRDRFKSSPLGRNPAALAREVEGAYRELWIEYCARK
jgi:predicted O-linked N-acetylglucosamine transferase (SPINDLY family)